ncbi:MAG: tRNA (N(6)-L-threonylcarbamoyladenosine(37)-C(2))-methylthiotransferase MtaB [Synergistaceae bacterium]|nr:tRNA (N(6)-L-threonylcarbamoyladenosine(37)-C(2))-methylthiotransferase MtaB [Synergistaceae bacterium]
MPDNFHLSGKTFSVVTMGCRVNHYEAEAVAAAMEAKGAVFVPGGGASADITIIVTCSVTSVADAKSRKIVRRARRANPEGALVACGCWAQSASSGEAAEAGVDILVGNRVKSVIPDLLNEWYVTRKFYEKKIDVTKSEEWDNISLDRTRMSTRAFIKVQDGCERRCSYCAVPSLRGQCVSRGYEDIVSEVGRVTSRGAREIVLTGIQLGGYSDGDVSLAGLLERISRVPGVLRLQMGSLEPFAVNEELLRTAADSGVFCPHLHIPVESGDDGVLFSMRRGYTAAEFARIADMTRAYLGDDVHISTDLIVGFPGESEEAFSNSLELLEKISAGKVHVFPYSPRKGTPSAAMERLPGAAVNERTARALELSEKLLSSYAAKWVGRENRVLAENVNDGVASGWNRHYVRVYFPVNRDENAMRGNEFSTEPKISIGSILLCEGADMDMEKIAPYEE